MSDLEPPRTTPRRPRPALLAALGVAGVAMVAVVAGCLSWSGPSASEAPAHASGGRSRHHADLSGRPPHAPHRALGVADGEVPDGATVFDDGYPAVANLDPALLDALREAATDAAADGLQLQVNSGWRSRAYQEELLERAVAEYGSRAEAARWVATPRTSPHVSGDAVDIGGPAAVAWLAAHGDDYGLCQIYGNEPWHYELRPGAVDDGCPSPYADPTDDPRMQQ